MSRITKSTIMIINKTKYTQLLKRSTRADVTHMGVELFHNKKCEECQERSVLYFRSVKDFNNRFFT